MKRKYVTKVACAVALVVFGAGVSTTASAVAISDGAYIMSINVTPMISDTIPDVGVDGAWNSSFTFNSLPSGASSQAMTDNNLDGVAGKIGINVFGGSISFTSFQVDPIDSFTQRATDINLMNGTTTMDVTTFNLTGRVAGPNDLKWDYAPFTSGASGNFLGTINGTAVVNVGDGNSDGLDDYTATFVSAGVYGPEWGSFDGLGYFEVWNVQINSVPLPAAMWLFASGLLGLLGIARRRIAMQKCRGWAFIS